MHPILKKYLHQLKAEKLRKKKFLKIQKIRKKSTSELTENDKIFLQKIGVMNGCGGRNRGILQKFFLKILTPIFFEASCDLHDFGYWKGWDEERRKECDRKFYEAMMRDIERHSEALSLLLSWNKSNQKFKASLKNSKTRFAQTLNFYACQFSQAWYKIIAKLFYLVVRIFWKKYFHYTRVSPRFANACTR